MGQDRIINQYETSPSLSAIRTDEPSESFGASAIYAGSSIKSVSSILAEPPVHKMNRY